MKRPPFVMVLCCLLSYVALQLPAQNYMAIPQVLNPVEKITSIQAGLGGEYFATQDDGLHIDIYNQQAALVLRWTDPDPEIVVNPKNGTKEFLKKFYSFTLFPKSRKFIVASSYGNAFTVVDFDGNTLKKGRFADFSISRIVVSPDESRFLFIPASGRQALLTDSAFTVLKRIRVSELYDAAFSPGGKWLALGEDSIESANGWKASLRLFTQNGDFVKDIENDRPGRQLDTPTGKKPLEQSTPNSLAFLNDNKLAYLHGVHSRQNTLRIADLESTTLFEFPIVRSVAYSTLSLVRGSDMLVVQASASVAYYTPDGRLAKQVELQNVNGEAPDYFYAYHPTYLAASGHTAMLAHSSQYYEDGVTEIMRILVADADGRTLFLSGVRPQGGLSDIRINHDASEIAIQRSGGERPSLLIDTRNSTITEIEGTVRYDYAGRRAVARWIMEGPADRRRKTDTMEFLVGDTRFTVAGGGYFLPNHYVAQEYTGYSLGAHWTLYDNKGEAVRRVLHDWHYEHGHDVNADLSRILYKAELWRMSDNKKTAFFFDGHLTGIGRFNPSGNKVMTGLEMGEIIIWTLDARPSAHYKGHVIMPSGMAMSADDTIMASTAADNLVIIRNLASGTVASLYLLHGNEFVVCTNKGAYDYSDDKRQLARLFSGGVDVTGRYPGARIRGLLDAVIQGRH